MNSFANRKKAFTVLLAIVAAICVAVALILTLPAGKAFAQEADGETAERTPKVTYIIGDDTVTDEGGFTYDSATNTYTYKDHSAGWSAAVAKSLELYNADEENANLVKVKLASDWIAQSNTTYTTSFGSATNAFNNGRIYITANCNIILDLNAKIINRNMTITTSNTGQVICVSGGDLEITDTSELSDGKVTGGYTSVYSSGGGITVSTNGTLILTKGIITNNYASVGGGVVIDATSRFIMNGGSIINNNDATLATGSGGGIRSSGILIVNGGIISGNFSGNGGGISVSGGSTTINNGIISGNNAPTQGGGVHVRGSSATSDATLFINGGEIRGNVSSRGGVLLHSYANCYISGKVIIADNYTSGTFNSNTNEYEGESNNNLDIFNPASSKLVFNQLYSGTKIGFAFTNNDSFAKISYSDKNKNVNGIVIDPSEYFTMDNGNAIVLAEYTDTTSGAISLEPKPVSATTYANMSFKADYETNASSASTEHLNVQDGEIGKYGAAFVYENGKKAVYSFSYGVNNTEQTPTSITKSGDENWTSQNGITDAGTYKLNYALGSNTVVFYIVILPYNIEGKTTYTVTASGWTDGEEQYTAQYDGSNKTLPSLALQLNNEDFAASNYTVTYEINGSTVTELKEVGEYTVVITGTGNYTGTVYASERFVITQNTDKSYTVVWQYYDGESWQTLSSGGAAFIYTGADNSGLVRIVLTADNETRYAYADGVTEYNLATGEDEINVTHGLIVGIEKDGETAVINAGGYTLTLNGTPNYTVAEADTANAVAVAKYDLSEITSESADTVEIFATLNNDTYSAQEKVLTLAASVQLSGNTVTLGTSGAEYSYTVKYINADGTETEVTSIILGGTYRIYITATGNNFEGTLGVVAEVVVNKANNAVTLSTARDWEYGTYDNRLHGVTGSATVMYDGTIAGTEQAYVYYTVQNSDGEAVNATLTSFTAFTDEVMTALNALSAGSYTVLAEVFETESYLGATRTVAFNVVKAVNRWVAEPEAYGWVWNAYSQTADRFYSAALYGNAVYTVTDANGNEVTDLANAAAGVYTLTATVEGTDDYSALTASVSFTVEKATNAWTESPSVAAWVEGKYDETANAVNGSAKYGEVTYKITDADGNEVSDLANAAAGTYTLTVSVAGTENYEGLTYTASFTVFESADMTGGEIAGIAIMGVVIAGLAAAVVVLAIRRRKTV